MGMSCIASALAMQLGEASRWNASQASVRHDLVVVRSPDRHGHPGLMQGLEPALVQVLVTEWQRVCGGYERTDAKRQSRRSRLQNEQELHRHCLPAPVQAQASAGQSSRARSATPRRPHHALVLKVKFHAKRH